MLSFRFITTACIRHTCSFSVLSTVLRENKLLNVASSVCNVRYTGSKYDPFAIAEPAVVAQEATAKKVRQKTPPVSKITLINTDDKLTICTLEEATKIANGKGLRLIQLEELDIRNERPVYKLMTENQYLNEELEEKKKKKSEKKKDFLKGEKIIVLSSRIAENDLKQKINKIKKWIDKRYEVKITISGVDEKFVEQENLFKELERELVGRARFLQKRIKNKDIRFHLQAPKEVQSTFEKNKPTDEKVNTTEENISSEASNL